MMCLCSEHFPEKILSREQCTQAATHLFLARMSLFSLKSQRVILRQVPAIWKEKNELRTTVVLQRSEAETRKWLGDSD